MKEISLDLLLIAGFLLMILPTVAFTLNVFALYSSSINLAIFGVGSLIYIAGFFILFFTYEAGKALEPCGDFVAEKDGK